MKGTENRLPSSIADPKQGDRCDFFFGFCRSSEERPEFLLPHRIQPGSSMRYRGVFLPGDGRPGMIASESPPSGLEGVSRLWEGGGGRLSICGISVDSDGSGVGCFRMEPAVGGSCCASGTSGRWLFSGLDSFLMGTTMSLTRGVPDTMSAMRKGRCWWTLTESSAESSPFA